MSAAGRAPWPRLRTVLFDLDGTLLDTAPDLARALNVVRAEEGAPPLPLARIRPVVSLGGRALVQLAFGGVPGEARFDRLLGRFLDAYAADLAVESRLFDGMDAVLARIEGAGLRWGVVTNKASWLTDPLLEALGLASRAASVVSGDTTANRKPHPEPLLRACAESGSAPAECVYVGDAPRDVEAGRRAGTGTLVALFGYIPAGEDPARWGADAVLASPAALDAWIARAISDGGTGGEARAARAPAAGGGDA